MKKEFIKIGQVFYPNRCLHSKLFNGFWVPCGKCRTCRQNFAREWSYRIEQEIKLSCAYNVLLTYEDDFLPFYKGMPTVQKVDCQLFMKRLRYMIDKHFKTRVRYFLVAEYGGKKGRPHYHLILFSDRPLESDIKGICDNGKLSFINDIINDEWKKGICDIEPLNSGTASAIYLLRYMTNYDSSVKYDIHNKPFRLISRGKSIGYNFFEDKKQFITKCIKSMNYTYPVKIEDKITGEERTLHFPLPRYYKRKIMPEEQQIRFADEHFDYSKHFTDYLNSLDYDTAKKRSDNHKINIERERELERAEFREKKVSKPHREASRLLSRATQRKKGTPI